MWMQIASRMASKRRSEGQESVGSHLVMQWPQAPNPGRANGSDTAKSELHGPLKALTEVTTVGFAV